MGTPMGRLRVHSFAERKGGATRYRWSVYGHNNELLTRSAASYRTQDDAYRQAARVAGLLQSVFAMRAN